MLTVEERLFTEFNRYRRPMIPRGVLAHSTGNPNASAEANWNYYNSKDVGASVHYFLDDTHIIRCVPENEQGGHVGNAWLNRTYIAVELCEMMDPAKHAKAYDNYTDLLADICFRYGWNAQAIITHNEVSCTVPEDTDHTDPTGYLGKMLNITPTSQGIANRVRADVQKKLTAMLAPSKVVVKLDGKVVESCDAVNVDGSVYGKYRPPFVALGARMSYSWKTKTLDIQTAHLKSLDPWEQSHEKGVR